jgi:putative ABC transport system substrate-binding protein
VLRRTCGLARSFIYKHLLDIRKTEDLSPAFDAATTDGIAAIAVGVDALTQDKRDIIADLASRHRIPTIYGSREYVDAGGLIAYGPSYPGLYRQAATYVDKILKGASPAELPIQQPTKFELIINLETAKALGLTVPRLLRAQAVEVNE